MDYMLVQQSGVSLGLGLLVGLQREWGPKHIAGIRTFGIITLSGTLCAWLSNSYGGWVLAAGLIGLSTLLITGCFARMRTDEYTPGLTTTAAAILMFMVGATTVTHMPAAITIGGATAVLLHWKKPLHSIIHRFSDKDLKAIIQLVLVSLVILPLLPDRTYGPYDVLNPFHIWLIVVLIVGISLAGYIISRFMGTRTGTLTAGVLGGVISSTATAVIYSRRTKNKSRNVPSATLIVLIASAIVFVRVAVEIALVAPSVLLKIAPQLVAMSALTSVAAGLYYVFFFRSDDPGISEQAEPSNLKAAVIFGLLYAVVLFAVAAVKSRFGDTGLYWISIVSGLTEMDAITLSTSRLVQQGRIGIDTGWRMILIGSMSNMVFKGAIVLVAGDRKMIRHLALFYGLIIAGGSAIVLFWP